MTARGASTVARVELDDEFSSSEFPQWQCDAYHHMRDEDPVHRSQPWGQWGLTGWEER